VTLGSAPRAEAASTNARSATARAAAPCAARRGATP